MKFVARFCVAMMTVLCVIGADSVKAQAITGADLGPEAPHLLKSQPAEAFQLELLDLAWQAAVAYPINPHIKNRGRAEEQVVHGALAIHQPHLAWGYTKKVVNWRKGACHAEIAHYLIEQEDPEHVAYFLRQAILNSKDPKQGWRQARVEARVNAARLLIGKDVVAGTQAKEEDFAGQGQAISAKAVGANSEVFDELIASLDSMVEREGYDEMWAAMQAYAELYRHHYPNLERRALITEKARVAWKDMPGIRRFEIMLRFANAALEHEDIQAAAQWVDEADAIRRSYRWAIESDLKLRSEIARALARINRKPAAQDLLSETAELADRELKNLQDLYRANALRPVAEAYAELGDKERALELYVVLVDLGALNPNIRPRVSDITATCVSMAVHGIQPDASLLNRIQGIVNELASR